MLTSRSWHQEIDINEEVSINEGTTEIIAVNLDNVFLKKMQQFLGEKIL